MKLFNSLFLVDVLYIYNTESHIHKPKTKKTSIYKVILITQITNGAYYYTLIIV